MGWVGSGFFVQNVLKPVLVLWVLITVMERGRVSELTA